MNTAMMPRTTAKSTTACQLITRTMKPFPARSADCEVGYSLLSPSWFSKKRYPLPTDLFDLGSHFSTGKSGGKTVMSVKSA